MTDFEHNSISHPVSIMMKLLFQLHNVPDYIEGEHIWSYIARLAEVNAFDSPEAFLNKIYSNFSYTHWKMFMTWGYEIERPFITNLIAIEDKEHWIVTATLYRALLPFHSRWEQANRIRKHAEEYDKASSKILVMKPTYVENLATCPVCLEEDQNNGTVHLHIVHQMPGISICPYHGTPLTKNNQTMIPPADSMRYAEFCKGLVENPIDANLKNTLTTIKCRVLELYSNMSMAKLFDTMSNDSKLKGKEDIVCYIKNIFDGNYREIHQLPYEMTIKCLTLLFDDYDDFRSSLYEEYNMESDFMAAIEHKYELVGEYSNNFVLVRCLACSTVFPATPLSMIMQRGCPTCDKRKTDKAIFDRMLAVAVENTGWIVESEFQKIADGMIFKNVETGQQEKAAPNLKLYELMESKWIKTSSQIAAEMFIENKMSEMALHEMKEKLDKASNDTFHLEIQENPRRFIATNGEKTITDVGFSELCQRVHIYVDQERREYMLQTIHRNMDDALVTMQGKILFTSDICPDPDFATLAREILKKECKDKTIFRFEKSTYFVGHYDHDLEEIIRRKFFDRYGHLVGVPIRNTLLSFLRTGKIDIDEPYFVIHSDSPDVKTSYMKRKVGDCWIQFKYVTEEFNDQNWLHHALINTLKDYRYVKYVNEDDGKFIADLCRHAHVYAEDLEDYYSTRAKAYINTIRKILKEKTYGESDI